MLLLEKNEKFLYCPPSYTYSRFYQGLGTNSKQSWSKYNTFCWTVKNYDLRKKAYGSIVLFRKCQNREYWMIYRGPSFLAVLPPPPLPCPSENCLSFSVFLCVVRSSLLTVRGGLRGRACSRILRLQESLGLHKSFNHLWSKRSSRKRCKQMSSSSYFFLSKNL